MSTSARAAPRWKQRPEGSNWGDFGPDDQRGRLNLLTPQRVLRALAEVRDGESFCLSLPLDRPGGSVLNPNRHPPVLRPTIRHGKVNFNFPMEQQKAGSTDVLSDDLAVLHLQYSTQWDSLAHAGSRFDADGDGWPEAVYYNGYRAGVDIRGPDDVKDAGVPAGPPGASTSCAGALGIENMARSCVQGRGVLADLAHHLGAGRVLVGYDLLMRCLEGDGVEVEEGDMLCLYTGFADAVLAMGGTPDASILERTGAVLDGRDRRLLQWITDSGVAVIAADNYAVESYPAGPGGDCCAVLPLHEHCLFRLGVHLGELWHLGPLARRLRGRSSRRFLLTAPPLYLPGAVGSPVTPVATI
jgi:Putative cyclase